MKHVPRSFEELIILAKSEHPELEWDTRPEISAAEDVQLVKDDPLRKALKSLTKGRHVNHMAFSQVILRELGNSFVLEREDKEIVVIQWFSEDTCIWRRAGGARQLRGKVYGILNRVAVPEDGLGEDAEPPPSTATLIS